MSDAPEAPAYGSGTLADVLPSAAGLLGVPGYVDRLGLEPAEIPEAVTVLLVDGLGWWPWHDALDRTPTLAAMDRRRLGTTVPSTTPTALASLGTGLPPGAHGIVGASFRLPETDALLHPLSWSGEPHPSAVQPEPTVFERVAAAGVPVLRVGASAYGDSGLTRAVLRGGDYVGADTRDAIVGSLAIHRRGLAYAYVPELDRTGHVHGIDSRAWRDALQAVDALVGRIVESLDDRHLLIVTADHGMIDCPPTGRVRVEDLPGFGLVETVAGEPRLRHVYCGEGQADRVASAWRDALGDRAWILTRDEFVASDLLGTTEEDYAARIGDVVALARDDTVLVSDADPLVSSLLGQHGSVSAAEMDIPLLQAWGSGRG